MLAASPHPPSSPSRPSPIGWSSASPRSSPMRRPTTASASRLRIYNAAAASFARRLGPAAYCWIRGGFRASTGSGNASRPASCSSWLSALALALSAASSSSESTRVERGRTYEPGTRILCIGRHGRRVSRSPLDARGRIVRRGTRGAVHGGFWCPTPAAHPRHRLPTRPAVLRRLPVRGAPPSMRARRAGGTRDWRDWICTVGRPTRSRTWLRAGRRT